MPTITAVQDRFHGASVRHQLASFGFVLLAAAAYAVTGSPSSASTSLTVLKLLVVALLWPMAARSLAWLRHVSTN